MSIFAARLKLNRCSCYLQKWQEYVIVSQKNHYCTPPEEKPPEKSKRSFRALKILPIVKSSTAKDKKIAKRLPDIDVSELEWTDVWVGPRTFDSYIVPLPLRQGFVRRGQTPPDKYANAELMKIPNFLHLTPPAVKKHCDEIRKFCTEWPKLLNEEVMDRQFPVNVITSDYCNSLPTIRDPLARIVTLKLKLSSLQLDGHSKDKFLRLVGARYDPTTDYITLTVDNCPLKKQNYDYAMYLLTALYFESWKVEEWESFKSDQDMEMYVFNERAGKANIKSYFAYNNRQVPSTTELCSIYEEYMDKGESYDRLNSYKKEVLKLLELKECGGVSTASPQP